MSEKKSFQLSIINPKKENGNKNIIIIIIESKNDRDNLFIWYFEAISETLLNENVSSTLEIALKKTANSEIKLFRKRSIVDYRFLKVYL
jgi:hypothetical protein